MPCSAPLPTTGTSPIRSALLKRTPSRFGKAHTDHDGGLPLAARDAAHAPMRDRRGRATMPPPQPDTPLSGQ